MRICITVTPLLEYAPVYILRTKVRICCCIQPLRPVDEFVVAVRAVDFVESIRYYTALIMNLNEATGL